MEINKTNKKNTRAGKRIYKISQLIETIEERNVELTKKNK